MTGAIPNIRGPVPWYPSQMQLVDEVHQFELQIRLALPERKGTVALYP